MTNASPCPDAEQLGALAEGRVPEEERRRLLEHLDRCEDCFTTFSEAAQFLEESARGKIVRGSFNRKWVWGVAAAAALLLAIFQLPRLVELSSDGPLALPPSAGLLQPVTSAAEVDELVAEIELDAVLAFSSNASREAYAFRRGVLLIDLRVAALAGDSQLIGRLAGAGREINREQVDELASLWEELTAVSQDPARRQDWLRVVDEIDSASRRHWEDDIYFQLGRWSETARLAAAAGQLGVLRDSTMRAFLEAAMNRLPHSSAARSQLEAIAQAADHEQSGTHLAQLLSDLQRVF